MELESITYDTENNKLIVTFDDETIKEYTEADKDKYLDDYPDRNADLIAMGWTE
jgi:hypothetical protein